MVAYLSLGLNCQPIISAIESHLVPDREGGRLTSVFDLCWTTSDALCHFIKTEFTDFFNDILLINNPKGSFHTPSGELLYSFVSSSAYGDLIVNTKHGMIFNHESPGHPFLASAEGWESPQRFCKNNFHELRERYSRRISTFLSTIKECINSDTELILLLISHADDREKITNSFANKYPKLRFQIKFYDFLDIDKVIYSDIHKYFHELNIHMP
jgi:hypothetical protein